MRWLLVPAILAGAACTEHGMSPDAAIDAPPVVRNDTDPAQCTGFALHSEIAQLVTTPPFTVGNVFLCLHLDATAFQGPSFSVATDDEPGSVSSFELTLTDGDRVLHGVDRTFGTADDPRVMATIDTDIPDAAIHEALLVVHARDGVTATTRIQLALFPPPI